MHHCGRSDLPLDHPLEGGYTLKSVKTAAVVSSDGAPAIAHAEIGCSAYIIQAHRRHRRWPKETKQLGVPVKFLIRTRSFRPKIQPAVWKPDAMRSNAIVNLLNI